MRIDLANMVSGRRMKIREAINTRVVRTGLLVIFLLGLLYVVLSLTVFEQDKTLQFFNQVFYSWLGIYERFATVIIRWLELPFMIVNTSVIFDGQALYEVEPGFLMRKWVLGLLFFFWIFPVKLRYKIAGSFLLFLFHFLITSFDLVILGSLIALEGEKGESAYRIAITPGVMVMTTFFVVWTVKFKSQIFSSLESQKIRTEGIRKKLPALFIIIYLYGFMGNFILGWFDYIPWINFLFVSSQSILGVFGYEAEVYANYLLGQNGSIYMEKGCLGFGTMALFAAVVYLTSNHRLLVTSVYMIAGIIFLNFVNILRFVFLFIHLQNNNGYKFAIEVHDMYNLTLYGVVFLLWVIWFELFVFRKRRASSESGFKSKDNVK